MAVSPHITGTINANLFSNQDYWYSTPWLGAYGCETPFRADNINGQMTRYVMPVGRWTSHVPAEYDNAGSTTRRIGQWSSYEGADTRLRPAAGYYTRTSSVVNEVSRYGYVASFSGGYIIDGVLLDALSTVDYEPCYGHSTAWPHTSGAANQYRDSEPTHLPLDGSSTITLTGSSYNKSKYLLPSFMIAHIAQGGTVGSGAIKFFLEERPSFRFGESMKHQLSMNTWELADLTGQPALCSRAFTVFFNRIHTYWWDIGGSAAVTGLGYPDPNGGTPNTADMYLGDARILTNHPVQRLLCESRVRGSARFSISEEYYGFVYGSNVAIMSHKMGMHPVMFFDLKTIWPSAASPRIAGVAVTPNTVDPKLYFLSESGELAIYDFTVKNGSLSLLAHMNAGGGNSLPSESKCSGLVWRNSKLYALVGTHAFHPLNYSEQTPTVGVTEYDPIGDAWGPINYSPLNGRLGSRTLTDMISLSNGKLAIVSEKIRQTTMRPDVFRTEVGWQQGVETWGGTGQNKSLIVRLGASHSANLILPRFKIRFRRTGSGSYNITSAKVAKIAKQAVDGTWQGGDITTPTTGLPFDQVVPITFNGGATIALVNNVSELDTDFIEMAMDTNAYDYYIIVGISGTSFGIPWTDTLEVGGTRSAFSTQTVAEITSTPVMPSPTNRTHFITRVFNDEAGNYYVNNGSPASGPVSNNWWEWQLMFFTPETLTWNVNTIDAGMDAAKAPGGQWGTHHPHTHLCEVQPDVLLFQANWRNDRMFIVDTTKPLATISNTDVMAIGQGAVNSVFPVDTVKTTSFLKNYSDNRVVFVYHEWLASNPGDNINNVFAPHAYDWKGGATTKITVSVTPDAARNGAGIGYFQKDMVACGDSNPESTYIPATGLMMLTHFAGNVFSLTMGYTHYWAYANRLTEGAVHYRALPTYYKWDGTGSQWVLADSFADAQANGYSVPATPNTPISIPWGLKLNFGPSTGTTFTADEWHTINASYGFVKFSRKARYTMAFFAGKTYNMTESRALADYADMRVRLWSAVTNMTITATGPETITYNGTGNAARFPRVKADGGMNDAPVVATYVGTVTYPVGMVIDGVTVPPGQGTVAPGCPDWSSAFVSPMDGHTTTFADGTTQVASASGYYNEDFAPWRMFAGQFHLNLRWQSNGNGGTPWVQIKLRGEAGYTSGRRLRAYQFYDSLNTIQSWKIQGSANGSTWVDLHTVTRTAPSQHGNAFTVNDPGVDYLYYRLQVLSSTGWPSIEGLTFFDQPLKNTWDITDIWAGASWPTQGHKFEVDQGSGFFEVSPLWISAGGEFRSFDRLTDVQKFRVTIRRPCNDTGNAAQAWVGDYRFFDYGIPTTHVTRLGSNAAAVNTPEKGSYDPECLGIAADVTTLWVDNFSPNQLGGPRNADQSGQWGAVTGWFYGTPLTPGSYKIHPFFGFVIFGRPAGTVGPEGGLLGSPTYVPAGTNLTYNYCWGRRV